MFENQNMPGDSPRAKMKGENDETQKTKPRLPIGHAHDPEPGKCLCTDRGPTQGGSRSYGE